MKFKKENDDMNQGYSDIGSTGNSSPIKYQDMYKRADSSCVDHETLINDVQLAHAYVPFQKFCPTFTPMASLKNGTVFPGLYDVHGWESQNGFGGE